MGSGWSRDGGVHDAEVIDGYQRENAGDCQLAISARIPSHDFHDALHVWSGACNPPTPTSHDVVEAYFSPLQGQRQSRFEGVRKSFSALCRSSTCIPYSLAHSRPSRGEDVYSEVSPINCSARHHGPGLSLLILPPLEDN